MFTRAISILLVLALVLPLLAQGNANDNRIYDAVRQRLANDEEIRGAGLDVAVKDGVVTLKGTVHDEKIKEKAEKVTKKIKGVTGVVNQLTIFGN
jgi:osmotically-inducible protein OsmY